MLNVNYVIAPGLIFRTVSDLQHFGANLIDAPFRDHAGCMSAHFSRNKCGSTSASPPSTALRLLEFLRPLAMALCFVGRFNVPEPTRPWREGLKWTSGGRRGFGLLSWTELSPKTSSAYEIRTNVLKSIGRNWR